MRTDEKNPLEILDQAEDDRRVDEIVAAAECDIPGHKLQVGNGAS